MSTNDVLWVLSGDTTVMYELLAEVPELVKMANKVAGGEAKYSALLNLSYNYF